MSGFEFSVDVLVMGGGMAGAVAALAAHDAGAQVLLVERDARPMGTSGMSMGVFCAAGTRAQAELGIEDSGEIFLADIMAKTHGQTDADIAHAIAFGSGPACDWLTGRFGLPIGLDTNFRASYGNSRQRIHGWDGHGGQDLLDMLHAKLADEEVMVLTEARVRTIVADVEGRVAGVEIERPGGAVERVGCGALVIASGGFAANADMLREFIPEMAGARNNGHEGSTGEGIMLARGLGAAVGDMGAYQGYAMLADPQGVSVQPGVVLEGGILVNRAGQRFTDETADIAGMVHPVLQQPGGHVWVVYDERIEALNAYHPDMQQLIALNAARRGDNVETLAVAIGVDPSTLTAALAEARAAYAGGEPDRLGRHWPSDVLPPHDRLLALKVVGAIYHTQGGLQIDREARVMRADGSKLPNLFACGGAARSVSGPSSWGYLPAMGLCTAVTLGRIAGQNAAAMVGPEP